MTLYIGIIIIWSCTNDYTLAIRAFFVHETKRSLQYVLNIRIVLTGSPGFGVTH